MSQLATADWDATSWDISAMPHGPSFFQDDDFTVACRRAYTISAESDGDSIAEVIFAYNRSEARGRHPVDWDGPIRVHREPELDGLEGAPIEELRRAQLDCGWWFTCAHCEREVSVDGEIYVEEDQATSLTEDWDGAYSFEPRIVGPAVYCNEWCHAAAHVARISYRMRKWAAVEETVKRFPGAVISGVCDTHVDSVLRSLVSFSLPEFSIPLIGWVVGDPTAEISRLHLDGWRAYRRWRQRQSPTTERKAQ